MIKWQNNTIGNQTMAKFQKRKNAVGKKPRGLEKQEVFAKPVIRHCDWNLEMATKAEKVAPGVIFLNNIRQAKGILYII